LIELMVVMGLLVLMASMVWPAMENQITRSELPESADRIRSMLYMARCEAVMEHRRYRIRFEPGEQQPLIEYERNPIRSPGEFEPVSFGWAQEQILLGDVQVYEVTPGRPYWTEPLSVTGSADQLEEDQEEGEEEEVAAESDEERREQEAFLWGGLRDEDIEVDENRPTIVFEADGSSDWATLILARIDPEQELEEEEQQLWVVLDGRTGLASIRDQVTEEMLEDEEFYVEREKLELPDLLDVDGLTFEVGESFDGGGSFSGGGERSFGDDGLGGGFGEAADELEKFDDEGFEKTEFSGGDTGGGESAVSPRRGSRRRGQARKVEDRKADPSDGGGRREGRRRDDLSDLDRKLADTDLSEEEREQMRRWYRDGPK
jgi:type II secretory pathway pseudopilin PulG